MVRVTIVGCAGRMGQEVARQLAQQTDMRLVAGIESPASSSIGQQCGTGIVHGRLADAIQETDVVVDFSVPAVTAASAELCASHRRPFVSGVTGLTDEQTAVLSQAANKVAVVWAPNFSLGVAVLGKLVAEAARLLGDEYDIELVETHHRLKQDAPSGTARQLVSILRTATGRTEVVSGRQGSVGPKSVSQIGVSAVRTGSVVGEHTVIFGGQGERVELSHKAESRIAFASGVIAAVRFVSSARPGLYGMSEVLASRV